MSYLTNVLADSPVVLWELAELSGASATDSSGSGNTGTYNGTPTLGQQGPIAGYTAMLDHAAGDYVTGGSFAYAGGSLTVECWVMLGSAPSGRINLCGLYNAPAGANASPVLSLNSSGQAEFYAYDVAGKNVVGVKNVCDGQWHLLAGTVTSSGSLVVYVDGQQDNTSSGFGTLWGLSNLPFNVASNVAGAPANVNGSEPVGVTFGWAAFYPTALTQTQLAAHYAAAAAGAVSPARPTFIYMRKREGKVRL